MNETQKKGSGCGAVALVLIAIGVAVIVAGVILFSFFFRSAKQIVKSGQARIEAEQKAHAAVRRSSGDDEILKLRQDKLADYAGYQAGSPLDRDVFVSWSVDPLRTTLGMDAFRAKAEGAMVTWELRAQDLKPGQDKVVGEFNIPYGFIYDGDQVHSSSSIDVRCEFGPGARDSLLAVRRGDWVVIRGRLSLKGDPMILDAALAGSGAEKE